LGIICRLSVVFLTVTNVLWLNGRTYKVLAIPLDRATTTTYKLLKVTMSLSAAFLPQFRMQCFSRHLYACQITVSYPSTDFSVQYSNVTRDCSCPCYSRPSGWALGRTTICRLSVVFLTVTNVLWLNGTT